MKFPQDEDFIDIARQALNSELPMGWEQRYIQNHVIYINRSQNKTQTQHPLVESYKDKLKKERQKKN
jgi:hypothetical protein